VTAYTVFNNHR